MNDAEKMDKLAGYVRTVRNDKVSRLVEITESMKAGEADDKLYEEGDKIELFLEAYLNNVTPALKAAEAAAESGNEEEVSRTRNTLFDELEKLTDIDDNTKTMFEKIVGKLVNHDEQLVEICKDIERLQNAVFNKSESKSNVGLNIFKKSDKSSEHPASKRDATDDKSKSKGGRPDGPSGIFRAGQYSKHQRPNRGAVNVA